MKIRLAARLVVLDEAGRVLLFRYLDRQGKEFWATPGGGLEPGETEEQAARREAAEEMGASAVELERLWTASTELLFANHKISQTETFFLLSPPPPLPGAGVEEAHRQEGIVETRWWTLAEIEAAAEPIFPLDLPARIRAALGGPPLNPRG